MAERYEPLERTGTDVSARLQSLRNMLNSERHISAEQQRALDAIDREAADRSAEHNERRREMEMYTRENDPSTFSEAPQIIRARRRMLRPTERIQRSLDRRDRLARAELSDNFPQPMSTLSPRPAAQGEIEDDLHEAHVQRESRSRAKRRKLDDGTYDDSSTIASYGDMGRMEPGPLQMRIVSCDGGEYYEPNGVNTKPEHVLSDDANVYCTKKNKCNILLKHAGNMPFALTKVVFKAPKHGYDAPFQEGLVFIALEDEKLVERASFYDRYTPTAYKHHPRRYDHYRPSHDYPLSIRSPLRTLDRLRQVQELASWSRYGAFESELDESRVAGFEVTYETPSEVEQDQPYGSPRPWHDADAEYPFRALSDHYPPLPPRNDHRTDLSGSSSGSDDEEVPIYRAEQSQRDYDEVINRQRHVLERMREIRDRVGGEYHTSEVERWNNDDAVELNGTSYRTLPQNTTASTTTSPQATLVPDRSPKKPLENTHTEVGSSNNLAPHARFKIRGRSASIAVKFDPPVSGRYVLVKLWAQSPNANIDIQSIIPYGYGGPRFFPVQDVR